MLSVKYKLFMLNVFTLNVVEPIFLAANNTLAQNA